MLDRLTMRLESRNYRTDEVNCERVGCTWRDSNASRQGFVETDMTAALSEDLQKQMLETIPLKRYGQVDDIAQAAVFLAKNTYITGQVLHVDGGMCM